MDVMKLRIAEPEDERTLVHAIAAKVDGAVLVAPRMSVEQLAEVRRVSPIALVNRVCAGIPGTLIPARDGMGALVKARRRPPRHRRRDAVGPSSCRPSLSWSSSSAQGQPALRLQEWFVYTNQ